jgi:hypothetical protein
VLQSSGSTLMRPPRWKNTNANYGMECKTLGCNMGVSYVSPILMRLNVSDRTQAVVTALRRGLMHLQRLGEPVCLYRGC